LAVGLPRFVEATDYKMISMAKPWLVHYMITKDFTKGTIFFFNLVYAVAKP